MEENVQLTKKSIDLTEADERFLYALTDYKFLNFEQIRRNFYPDKSSKHVRSRIERMINGKYLQSERWVHEDIISGQKCTKLYFLDSYGVDTCREALDFPTLKQYERPNTHSLHMLQLSDIVEVMSQGGEDAQYKYEFVEYVSEYNTYFQFGETERDVIRPDGVVILLVTNKETAESRYVAFFIEYERTVKKRPMYNARKVVRYNQYSDYVFGRDTQRPKGFNNIYSINPVSWGVVLFISHDERLQERIIKDTRSSVNDEKQPVLYNTIRQLKRNPFERTWLNKKNEICNIIGR